MIPPHVDGVSQVHCRARFSGHCSLSIAPKSFEQTLEDPCFCYGCLAPRVLRAVRRCCSSPIETAFNCVFFAYFGRDAVEETSVLAAIVLVRVS